MFRPILETESYLNTSRFFCSCYIQDSRGKGTVKNREVIFSFFYKIILPKLCLPPLDVLPVGDLHLNDLPDLLDLLVREELFHHQRLLTKAGKKWIKNIIK
jgi:hypothetical protein